MKPTLQSITAAYRLAQYLEMTSESAKVHLAQAGTAHLCTSPKMSRESLVKARRNLNGLRRSQTAALRQIDEAIKSLT